MFEKQTYIDRRDRLRKGLTSGVLLFLGNDESPMNYHDNPFHFRQDSTFLYFFGLNFAGLAAVMDLDENRDVLFGDDLTVDDIVWMGTQPTLAERGERVGIREIRPAGELSSCLEKAKSQNREIHFLPPYRGEHKVKLFSLMNIHPDGATAKASLEFIKAVVNLRNIKSGEEIAEIDRAAAVSTDMHIAAMKMARPGMRESEIAAEVERIALASGGHPAFPVIATIHGETLHNHYHGNVLKNGDLFLLDAGAETSLGYAGDLSSTFPVDRSFTGRQKEIYQVVLTAHEAAVTALRPGFPFREVHLLACRTLVEGLKDLGFMRGNVDDAVTAGAHALFFPCGTGHMMGLDVHDMENLGEKYVGYDGEEKSTQFGLKSLRLARKLEPGFVLTIEPGIYFIPELIDLWKAQNKYSEFINYDRVEEYKGFGGVRNEENFVINEDGYRLLGGEKPKTISEVENLRGS